MKYGDKPTIDYNIKFASKKEAHRYLILRDDLQHGRITNLETQPEYKIWTLREDGTEIAVARYVADFRYVRDGKTVIEDVKGVKTPVYKLKKKLIEARYGIRILET